MSKQKEKNKLDFPLYQYVTVSVWCEECSTQEHPIMCEEIDGIYYRCPLCKKEVMVLAEIKTNVGTHYATDCKRCKDLKKKGIVLGRREEIVLEEK